MTPSCAYCAANRHRETILAQPDLASFVASALRQGAPRDELRRVLDQAGWSPEQIGDALDAFADIDFVEPVPRPRAQLSARDAFIYLVMFGALYTSAYHFGNLLFQFVNLSIPDELADSIGYAHTRVRFAIAALVVAFPLYLFLSVRTSREVAADPGRRTSAVRRWLVYLTLTAAAFIVVGDLIALIYGLLSGELTLRFLLKAAIVGAIAGGAFGYYLWSVKSDDAALAR